MISFFLTEMELRTKLNWILLLVTLQGVGQIIGEGLRLPDQQAGPAQVPQQHQQQNVQQIFHQQQQQPQLQQQLQQQQQPGGFGEERGRSSILSIFGLGQDNDPYLARTNTNCLSGDLSECFKTHALNTFDEILYRDQYRCVEMLAFIRTK